MKKIICIALILATFSCKKEENADAPAQLNYVDGTFLMTKEAAIIQGDNKEMYIVKVNDIAKKLAEQCKAFQKSEFDMVPVSVKGVLSENPDKESHWKRMITIKEILKVTAPTKQEEIIEIK